jgi:N-acetylneuraminate synthase
MYGSDAVNAMEPADFKLFCGSVKTAARMRENPVNKDDLAPYRDMKRVFEKSIVTARAIERGRVLVRDDLAFKKPDEGMPAANWRAVVGRRVARDLAADHMLGDLE